MGPKSRLHQALQAMWGSALVLGAAVALSGCVANDQGVNAADLKWQSISFGQSTDINFATNVLPNKVGKHGTSPARAILALFN